MSCGLDPHSPGATTSSPGTSRVCVSESGLGITLSYLWRW